MTEAVAALAAGGAAHLLLGWRRSLRRAERSASPGARVAVGVAAVAAAALLLLDGTHFVVALVALAVVIAVGREVDRRRRSAAADRRADLVLALCDGLAADLRAGQPPVTALEAAAEDWSELVPVASAARLGADVPTALRALAGRPGAGQLRVVAAAWQVAHRSGAGLARALELAAGNLRAERATARVVATELVAAEATARLLAALPLGVLLLGSGLGGDPLGFLLGTTPGLVCLVVGLGLAQVGMLWLARIGDQVTGRAAR